MYSTFFDSASVDHGDLGAEIITEKFEWEGIPENFRDNIIAAVRFHNKKTVPSDLKLGAYKWSCLVRDADKIDISALLDGLQTSANIGDYISVETNADGKAVISIDRDGASNGFSASDLLILDRPQPCQESPT